MHKPSKTAKPPMGAILTEILKTAELRSLSQNLVSEILQSWAGEKVIRHKTAGFINNRIEKLINAPRSDSEKTHLATLFENPDFFSQVNDQLPLIVKGIGDLLPTYFKQLESQPAELKLKLVKDILEGVLSDKAGESFTLFIRLIKSCQDSEDGFFSATVLDYLSHWLKGADFGELKEMLESSREGIETVIQGANELIWQYPAKLLILISLAPFVLNLGVKGAREVINGFNQAPPDLVADIAASLVKDFDSDSAIDLIGEILELSRKILTGSALIGDPGAPRITGDIVNLVKRMEESQDETVFYRSKLALFREKTEINNLIHASLYENKDRLNRKIVFETTKRNIKFQHINHDLSLVDNLSDAEFKKIIDSISSEFDNREFSELIEQVLRILERTIQVQPDLLPQLIEQLTQQLDPLQLQDLMSEISENTGKALNPLGRAIIPKLVVGVCHYLSPADDEFEEGAREARKALRTLFAGEEVHP